MIKIGIIGGSGLDNPEILQNVREVEVETPFGLPSSSLKLGTIGNTNVVLLARHGREHTVPPTQVNYRANIHALKDAGCTHILATTACGSLKEEIGRGDFVILDQFIDFTRHRAITFHEKFDPGNVVHTPMAEPFCSELRRLLVSSAQELGLKFHDKGTVITIEGPRFSTKAESHMFRTWGADVINMSVAPEAILAKEAGIPYAAIAMSTDFDCWKEDEAPVSWEEILKVFNQNSENVIKILLGVINKMNSVKGFDLRSVIRTIPNWPKKGIMFRDITTLLDNPDAFAHCIQKFKEKYAHTGLTKIAGIESRGFIFGAVLAQALHLPFVLVRKKGKLPGEVVSQEYQLEYGVDQIEVHKDAIRMGDKVLVIDDLIATAGTLKAATRLVEKLGGAVFECAVVIELTDLRGREALRGHSLFSLVQFEGE